MDVRFDRAKDARAYEKGRSGLRREFGNCADRIAQRLNELFAAENLWQISTFPPPRLHQLTGNRKGSYTVDVDRRFRILFRPDYPDAEVPRLPDGGIDKQKVEKVLVLNLMTNETHE